MAQICSDAQGLSEPFWASRHPPLLAFFRSLLPLVPTLLPMLSWTRSCLTPPAHQAASADELTLQPFQQDHAFAAFVQGDWLAELDLLQLGTAFMRGAIARGGYDGRSFDLMVAIADVLHAPDDEMVGRGTYKWSDGHVYDGDWAGGKRHGLGRFNRPDNVILYGRYVNGHHKGEGVRWSADRMEAQLVVDGVPMKSVSLTKAKEIATNLGFVDALPPPM